MDAENNNVRILTAQQIWDAKDIEERVVPVPQWGGAVRIRTLTQKQSGDLRKKATRTNMVTKQSEIDNELLEALLFTEGVIEPRFTMADYGKLQEKSMAAVSLVLRNVMDASGLTEDAVKDATKSAVSGPEPAFRVQAGEGFEEDEG